MIAVTATVTERRDTTRPVTPRAALCRNCRFVTDADVAEVFGARLRRVPGDEPMDNSRRFGWDQCLRCTLPEWQALGQTPKVVACHRCARPLVARWLYLTHGTSVRARFCGEMCYRAFYAANRRRRHRTALCPVCVGTFRPPRSDARYCSNACRQRAYRARGAA